MLNQRGQEFSVFKLLISAIVAIVVLTLLLNILGIVNFNPNTDPSKSAVNLLTSMDSSQYQEKVSARIDFTKENSINAKSLAKEMGLDEEQICLAVQTDLESDGFSSNGKLIRYTGSNSVRVKLAGICAEGTDFADAEGTGGFFDSYAPTIFVNSAVIPSECSIKTASGKACFMVLIKSNE